MTDKKLWLGIDGGGTRSEWVLCDDDENVIDKREGPPLQASVQTIPQILDKLKSGFLNYQMETLSGICVGLSGLGHPEKITQLEQALAFYVSGAPIVINSDANISHRGIFNNQDGTLIITGTGSIILMRQGSKWYRKCGWGPKIGDPASGNSIGMSFLRNIIHDKLYEKYKHILTQHYHTSEEYFESDLLRALYEEKLMPAHLSPAVLQLAEDGDELCKNIISMEIAQLTGHLKKLFEKTTRNNNKLALHGGLTSHKYFLKQLKFHILDEIGDAIFVDSLQPSALAACRVIKHKISR